MMKDKVNTEDLVVDPQTKGYLIDRKELIEKLLKTNVNEHTEKKNGLTYLSWAWAWAEALKADSSAWYKIEMFGDKCYMDINGTAMVFVTVTMYGKPMTCQLPVMDYRNKAIPNPDAFAVNTAIMRCMTKALSLHGLGLYIYAGEDLPEGESDEGTPDEGKMLDYIAAIEATTTVDELKNIYIEAFAATDGNKAWQTKMIAAKDAKKKGLK
tara:strand:- start:96 stop:728 length:633 start_codon:yes stop_codon:yes gene_type:complete